MFKKIAMAALVTSLLVLAGCSGDPPKINTGAGSSNPSSGGSGGSSARQPLRLTISQRYQPCGECGIWFSSSQVTVSGSAGTYRTPRMKAGVVKKDTGQTVQVNASLRGVRSVSRATMYLTIHSGEGIANADNSSVLVVKGVRNGRVVFVRTITARQLKSRGNKSSRPTVPIDITRFVRSL